MWKYFVKGSPVSTKSGFEFKMTHTFEKRKAESTRLRETYPLQYPIILERADRTDLPEIDKKKYLLPGELTVGQFLHYIRKQIKLDATQALFIFIDNSIIPPASATIGDIYNKYMDQDGYLYILYSKQETYGI
ncbi:autophagy protein atg8 ubiquitin-like protein [Fadolivirus algeromassiliense]|jgi:GABA(A) receptor-associated protein|uniref:Autophagy protein atg8 ubiquitin-like protein n=1 Tax=Fadolivirus FV1/VV64 TaxID=3070911 RepID=A0A7D3QV81_9VIRU|nr:autophagy protein atg8 ubiquitin-like protein [Fadolivirus algeromassiliense]QKF93706.1 autophagy protein atg8 ubiquitin-like protein [Fadolivirus FV1/VV64]